MSGREGDCGIFAFGTVVLDLVLEHNKRLGGWLIGPIYLSFWTHYAQHIPSVPV